MGTVSLKLKAIIDVSKSSRIHVLHYLFNKTNSGGGLKIRKQKY